MNELHTTAEAYYRAATPYIRQLAFAFYKEMDENDDGGIALPEYLAFMKNRTAPSQMKTKEFFKKLDKDGIGTLKFGEIITLYYIINSGRPFCDGCGDFIEGQFFTCTECFDYCSSTFNVCSACFIAGAYVHNHNQFLDNFVLLETKRTAALNRRKQAQHTASASQTMNTCTALVPVNPQNRTSKWKTAVQYLAAGVNLGSQLASNLCCIM